MRWKDSRDGALFSLHKKGVAAPRAASAARVSALGSGRTEGDGAGGSPFPPAPPGEGSSRHPGVA